VATIRSELKTRAPASDVWSAIRDIGALHTRLVPGFVTDTKLEPGARIVTFINGMVVREPIVTLDDEARRLVWTADFLPDDASGFLSKAIEAGMAAMQRSLDALAA
jgi:hypothetical protein